MTIHVINVKDQTTNGGFHIYCGRGTALGNPYRLNTEHNRNYVCDQYEKYFNHCVNVIKEDPMVNMLEQIKDASKDGDVCLVCHCAPKRCHCETIKRHVEGMPNE